MKPNPFFFYLLEHQPQLITQKREYLMVSLLNPEVRPSIQIKGRIATFQSHHMTVHERYNEGTQYNSLYHYTASFEGWVVHVYFDSQGDQSDAYIKEDSQEYKSVAEPLPESEKATIQLLILNFLSPVAYRLKKTHVGQVNELSAAYYDGLTSIRAQLFEQTMMVEGNLLATSRMISIGESLKRISYFHRDRNLSLNYLKKQHISLSTLHEKMKLDAAIEARTQQLGDEEVDVVLEESMSPERGVSDTALGLKKLKAAACSMRSDAAQQLCQTFETAYDRVDALLLSYDAILFNDFQKKTTVLHQVSDALADLLAQSDSLTRLDQSSMPNERVLHKAGLGLDYLFHTCESKGALLLTLCLSSTKERLQMYGPSLSKYSDFISLDCIDASIRKGNVHALTYLIEHGLVEINRHQVQLAPNTPTRSLICAAYQLNHLDCFVALVKHKANLFSVYQDDLPLAYTLINLSIDNPFRQALVEHSSYFQDKTATFYSILIPIVRNQLSCNTSLTEEQSSELSQRLDLYESIKESGNISGLSKYAVREATQIAQKVDQNLIERLKKSPAYTLKLRTITHLSKQLSQIIRCQRQESRFKSESTRFFRTMNQQLDESALLRDVVRGITEEDMLDSMDANISKLEDYIFIWNNQNKVLSKKKAKLFNETLKRLQVVDEEKTQQSKSLTKLRGKVEELVSALATILDCIKKDESDEFPGLDFLEVSEEQMPAVSAEAREGEVYLK